MTSLRLRTSSMPRLLAASSSTTSSSRFSRMATQASQTSQGSDVGPSLRRQHRALARSRAEVVLPVPRGPQKR